MKKNVAISEVTISYSEKPWKIFIWDILFPIIFSALVYFCFWKWLGPHLFKKFYYEFKIVREPNSYYVIKNFFYNLLPYFGLFLCFGIFGVTSFQNESIPGPGRLLKILFRSFKKRTELNIEKKYEDLSHPAKFEFRSPEVQEFIKNLRGESKVKIWNYPWERNSDSICIGSLNAFEAEKRNKFKYIVLETSGRNLHTAIIGASGSGKTISYIGPTLALDSLNPNVGTFTINPKGDLKLKRFAFAGIHQHFQKTGEFLNRIQVISFSDRKNSLMYDPFLFGSDVASSLDIQNKIIGSMTFENEFYKTMASTFVTKFAAIMGSEPKLKYRLTLRHLVYYLSNPQSIAFLTEYVEDSINKENLNYLQKQDIKNLLGIQGHLSTFVDNADISHIFDDFEKPCLNIVSTLQDSGNVFVEVDTISKGAVSKSFGKMLVRDLQIMASKRDSGMLPHKNLISVNLDEFGSFAYGEFIDFLDKGRSSGFLITLAFQDLANLQKDGLPRSFMNEVLANTSNKLFFKLADNTVSEYASEFLGTRYAKTETESFSASANTLADSQQGSKGVRFQNELIPYVLPSELQTLKIGQCYAKIASPKYGPIVGAGTIGLFPDDGMPSSEEVLKYMSMSYKASQKHPGHDKLLGITNDFDPYGKFRNRKIQEPIISKPKTEIKEVEETEQNLVEDNKESDSQEEIERHRIVKKDNDDIDDILSALTRSEDD